MNHLIIRADSTNTMGTGHIMRCLALAQSWQDNGGEVTFLSHCQSEELHQRLLNEGFRVISECDQPLGDDIARIYALVNIMNSNTLRSIFEKTPEVWISPSVPR